MKKTLKENVRYKERKRLYDRRLRKQLISSDKSDGNAILNALMRDRGTWHAWKRGEGANNGRELNPNWRL
jgi:hypothetical protein